MDFNFVKLSFDERILLCFVMGYEPIDDFLSDWVVDDILNARDIPYYISKFDYCKFELDKHIGELLCDKLMMENSRKNRKNV